MKKIYILIMIFAKDNSEDITFVCSTYEKAQQLGNKMIEIDAGFGRPPMYKEYKIIEKSLF